MEYRKIPKPKRTRQWRIDEMTGIGSIDNLNTVASTIDGLKKQVPIYNKIKKPHESQ